MEKMDEFIKMYKELKYTNKSILQLGEDILRELYTQGKKDIIISKTGENELLIYRIVDGEYRNIIIDEDAHIEYLKIPIDRENTINEYLSFEDIKDDSIFNLIKKF